MQLDARKDYNKKYQSNDTFFFHKRIRKIDFRLNALIFQL